ncbi:Oidioi.mRNA.OKI2018_I69.PAR.g12415.t1.cds [Oikopleura dioica]|uniref:receptor protein serine/threonine kinase n=1 Tax=Oikopleura dioica TaxID=34765 RepID=A0ABN7S3F0_OIKDI|nr:Oidioi.mRNA.OKI2018_I69.PAR.g12415.t1.cds [Oikopleura dioica]
MTQDEHSMRIVDWHESVEKWCKVTDLGTQSYRVMMFIPSLYQTTGCDKFPLWGIIVGFFFMFVLSIFFFYYDRIHMMHLCPEWLKKNNLYVHGNAAQSLVNNERNSNEIKPPASHEIKLAHPKLTSDIQYCYKNKRPVVLGEGRYGFVYKANYEEQCIAVKCIDREEKAEHEKIMFDLIGSRSDNLLRLTAYVSKHCDPNDRPTSVLLLPAYLQLMRTLACGLYELHRASEGIDNPMPRIAHRDLKPANVLISDRFEAVICDFNSSIPLIRELPHQCDCFSKPDDRNGPCRPFEPLTLLKLESHDRPGCPNRKILQKLDDVRERVFYQKCPDGTWLYMAPEVLSLSMFDTGDMVPTNSDMVNRYCSVDIYSFGLIAWIILSQCDGFLVPDHKLDSNVDDFLFHEFSSQSKIDLTKINLRSLAEKEKLMHKIVNEENLRPRCGSSPLFDVIRDCWASDGAYRPDARQIYRKIKDLSAHYTRM